MAAEIMIGVPYEVTINATDTRSGKPISNILYYRYGGAGTYGANLGGTDQQTFHDNVKTRWSNHILNSLSNHYVMSSVRSRAITGWHWTKPLKKWVGSSPSLTFTSITTATPHGFTTGMAVQLIGTIGATSINQAASPITVTGTNQFTIPVLLAAGTVTNGTVQEVGANVDFTYDNNLETTETDAGSRPGETVPLFCSASVRRINLGVGRNWKSRISLSPFAEPDVVNGMFESAFFTSLQANVDGLNNNEAAGGGFVMTPIVVSRQVALLLSNIFTESDTWTRDIIDFTARRNMGSIISRKPKLTATISAVT